MAEETIVAIATAPGQGGVGIVRLSGVEAREIANKLADVQWIPRQLQFADFTDSNGNLIDKGLVVLFPGPNSFTGEDVVEFQGHGGPVVLNQIVQAALTAGARLAKPGEFSERAFLNGKMDLAQAEAVADLIASTSQAAARGALRSLCGEFSQRVEVLAKALLEIRVRVEALLDFPEEDDVELYGNRELTERLVGLEEGVQSLLRDAGQGKLLRDGIKVAIVGSPNAGKSSLLNALAREDRAIVTPYEGTTRDLIAVDVSIGGLPIQLVDTAGLRKSDDPIEQEGIRRATTEAANADLVLYVMDITNGVKGAAEGSLPNDRSGYDMGRQGEVPREVNTMDQVNEQLEFLPAEVPCLRVLNKVDLLPADAPAANRPLDELTVRVSALQGIGLQDLTDKVCQAVGFARESSVFSARQRHVVALKATAEHLQSAKALRQSRGDGVLLAEELRLAHHCLGEITGQVTADELLGEIFRTFCMGK